MTTHYSTNKSGAVISNNLSAVTTATSGDALEVRDFTHKTVFVKVSANTGAVTVNVEISESGDSGTWSAIGGAYLPKTYTAANTSDEDSFDIRTHAPFMRTRTSTQSASSVTTRITGGN